MKLFVATLAALAHGEQYCQPGRQTGINADGEPDASNTSICYVTKDAAQVTRCNEVGNTGGVEMAVKVLKALFPVDWKPSDHSFTESVDKKYYERVYKHNELADKSVDTTELILQAGVPFKGDFTVIGSSKVYTKIEGGLSFRCKYPLGIQTITTDPFTVSGSDTEISRTGTGDLTYTIETDADNVKIGDWNQFKIKPTTAGLVHAQVNKCTIQNNAKTASVVVFGNDDAFCRNKYVDFTVVSGFGSTGDQVMKYKAFKWSTLKANDVETQHISCNVGLQKAAFGTTATPYCADAYN